MLHEPWRIELLGGLRLHQGNQVITRFRSQKTGALLAYLAFYRQQTHPREILIEMLWPDTDPRSGRNSLNVALSSLRHQLEPPGVPAGTVLATDNFSVRVNPDAVLTDVAAFEAALEAANQVSGRPDQAPRLSEAVALFKSQLLPGYYEDWILPEQERLTAHAGFSSTSPGRRR